MDFDELVADNCSSSLNDGSADGEGVGDGSKVLSSEGKEDDMEFDRLDKVKQLNDGSGVLIGSLIYCRREKNTRN